jgi:hypothetical protein
MTSRPILDAVLTNNTKIYTRDIILSYKNILQTINGDKITTDSGIGQQRLQELIALVCAQNQLKIAATYTTKPYNKYNSEHNSNNWSDNSNSKNKYSNNQYKKPYSHTHTNDTENKHYNGGFKNQYKNQHNSNTKINSHIGLSDLQKSDNGWKPNIFELPISLTDEVTTSDVPIVHDFEKYKKELQALLNKLTIEKFDDLATDIVTRVLDETYIDIFIEQVVIKSIGECNFCFMYARLFDFFIKNTEIIGRAQICRKLSQLCRTKFDITESCPDKFENDADLKDMWNKKQLRLKDGVITLIGELFVLNINGEVNIKSYIDQLLTECDFDKINLLIIIVGKKLELSDRKYIDEVFTRLHICSVNVEYDTRTRFKLMDLIELRKNKWVKRQKEQKATTKKDLQKQVIQDKFRKKLNHY